MNVLILLGAGFALLAYIPLWIQIPSGKVKQNLLSWVLWGMLEIILTIAVVAQKGNFLLFSAYFMGTGITVWMILRTQGRARWTRFESFVITLVILCLVIWYTSGSKVATIASTLAMFIAGVPQLVDAWKRPREMPLLTSLLYLTANSLSSAGGKNWSIEERMPATCAALYSLTTIIFILRRYRATPTTASA